MGEKRYAIGVDIGGTTVKLGLFNLEGEALEKWEIPTVKEAQGSHILPDIAASIRDKAASRDLALTDVLGVGVGAPGPVDAEGTVHRAVNLGWGVLNIPQALQALLELPVKAANDANAAAFGEMWQGGGKGHSNIVAVTLGTGVGGGIIVNGSILTGATGAGGEIGHLHIVDGETEACGCGNFGCLEQYASATGVARLARRRLEQDQEPSVLRGGELSAKAVWDAVKAGDRVAVQVAEQFGLYLGKGLAAVAAVANPEVFVIGGGVSKAGEILFDYIRPAYEKYVFQGCRNAEFALATLGNDAGIFGAAALILN